MTNKEAVILAINEINKTIYEYSKHPKPVIITEIHNHKKKFFKITFFHGLDRYKVLFSYFNNILMEQPLFKEEYKEGMCWLKHQIEFKEKLLEVENE